MSDFTININTTVNQEEVAKLLSQLHAMQAMASAMGVSNEQMNACIQGKPIPKNTKATK